MDFILEHNDDPVPDPAAQGLTAPSAAMDIDEDDEDAAAIRAALGKASANVAPVASSEGGEGSGGGEARVRRFSTLFL